MDWMHKMSSASWIGNVKKDIAELARYFHHKVVEDFKNDPKHRFQIIDSTEQHTQPALILKLALIWVPPVGQVICTTGGFVLPE